MLPQGRRLVSDRFNFVCCSQGFLSIYECLNAIVHVLHKFAFRTAEAAQVRDVEDTVAGIGVLAMSAANLNKVLFRDRFELLLVLLELWQFDVHGGTHSSSQVSRARSDETVVVIVSELKLLLDDRSGSAQAEQVPDQDHAECGTNRSEERRLSEAWNHKGRHGQFPIS